jgi:hypothetical protein
MGTVPFAPPSPRAEQRVSRGIFASKLKCTQSEHSQFRVKETAMPKKGVGALIGALVLLAIGGLLLHLKIHPPLVQMGAAVDKPFNFVPLIFCVLNILVIPFLLASPKTVRWAYLFVWLTVVVGTAGMAYKSYENFSGSTVPVTVKDIVLNSTLADILILIAKIPIAYAILRRVKSE